MHKPSPDARLHAPLAEADAVLSFAKEKVNATIQTAIHSMLPAAS